MQNLTSLKQRSSGAVENKGIGKDGLNLKGIARFTFDTAAKDSGKTSNKTVAAHGTGVILPANAVVVGGGVEVNTAFTSAGGTATIAISVVSANDIITAAAVSGAPYSSTGLKAITPKNNTPESTGIKLSAAKEITCTVAVQALTAGKLTGWLEYVVTAATA